MALPQRNTNSSIVSGLQLCNLLYRNHMRLRRAVMIPQLTTRMLLHKQADGFSDKQGFTGNNNVF